MTRDRVCGRLGCPERAHAKIHVPGKGKRVVCKAHTENCIIVEVLP